MQNGITYSDFIDYANFDDACTAPSFSYSKLTFGLRSDMRVYRRTNKKGGYQSCHNLTWGGAYAIGRDIQRRDGIQAEILPTHTIVYKLSIKAELIP